MKVEFQTQAVERLVENLPNIEAITDKVDHLPFAGTFRVNPADIGDAEVTGIRIVAHICVDQVMTHVGFVHFPGRIFFFFPAAVFVVENMDMIC